MMKLALSGAEPKYKDVSINVLLDDALQLGLNWIELWHPANTAADGLDQSLEAIERSEVNVATMSALICLANQDYDASSQASLLELVDLAARLGAPLVNTYFGHAKTRDDQLLIETYAKRVAPCVERAEEVGVTIVLENECDVPGHDPAESDITRRPRAIRELVSMVDSANFRLTFDAVNFYLAGVEPFPWAYSVLADLVAYVHMKDAATILPEQHTSRFRKWVEHGGREYVAVPLGEGAVNQEGLLNRLQADGYDGFLTLEPHAPTAHLFELQAQAVDYLRERISDQ